MYTATPVEDLQHFKSGSVLEIVLYHSIHKSDRYRNYYFEIEIILLLVRRLFCVLYITPTKM